MSDRIVSAAMFAAALGSGLMAGLFFIFSVTIMTALARLPAPNGIAAMQSINKVILNAWFLSVFLGTAAICVGLAVSSLLNWRMPVAACTLAASVLYLAGCIVVTMIWNVPLNNRLEAADPASPEAAQLWSHYLDVWTGWNHVRTLACTAAAALFTFTFGAE